MLTFEEKYRLMKLKEGAMDIFKFCECALEDADEDIYDEITKQLDMRTLEGIHAAIFDFMAEITDILNKKET